MNIEMPEVSRSHGLESFDASKIYGSLIRETSLNINEATFITKKVVAFIVSSDIQFLSGPLLREIINVKLLQFGYEKQRLEYTRIGIPFYDLKKIFDDKINNGIFNHMVKEFEAVKKLIEERE
jgi:ribonucleoside-triphosphate reductase